MSTIDTSKMTISQITDLIAKNSGEMKSVSYFCIHL
jgi:hypothetical protein